jgi:hypothetical protein
MMGIDVFYQLCYFLSLNDRNAYIQRRREYKRCTEYRTGGPRMVVVLLLLPPTY